MENVANDHHRSPVAPEGLAQFDKYGLPASWRPDNPDHVRMKEQKLFEADPVGLLKAGYLWIKDNDGNLRPLTLNSTQKKLVDTIQDKRRQGLPVRIVILKARQLGTSTCSEGLLYAFTSQRGASNALVLADDEEGASYIFKMNEVFHEEMTSRHPHLTPKRTRSDERRLEFGYNRSSIRIETANNKRAGRKYTFRFAHLSECAFYKNFTDLMAGLKPSMPDKPETVMILETTANGMNDFAKFWFRIKDLFAKGQTDWVPLFLSWKEHEEYVREFLNADQEKKFEETLSKDERELAKTHGLTLEQLNWRRRKIQEDFNGDQEKFEVEFPLTDREAFKSTSRRVFPDRLTEPQRSNLSEPKFRGEIERMERRSAFLPDKQGFLKVWQEPQPERRYVIGADSCESALSHDEACAHVIDRSTWTQVAHLHGHISPDVFAQKLFALGQWYNWATIDPERNGPGLVTVTELARLYYPNIAKTTKSVVTDNGQWVETEEFGFHTNVKTKPEIIDFLGRCLRDLMVVLHDDRTLDQLVTFVIKSVNKDGYLEMGAEDSFRDDCVMALAITLFRASKVPNLPIADDLEIPRVLPDSKTGY